MSLVNHTVAKRHLISDLSHQEHIVKETKFILSNAEKCLELLREKPYSINELSKELKVNYYSIRNAILHLENVGSVKAMTGSKRNTPYMAINSSGPNRIIPTVHTTNGATKLHNVVAMHENPRPSAAVAVIELPKNVTRLFKVAEKLHNHQPIGTSLTNIRHEMEQSLIALQNAVNVYQQILDNPRVWSPELLAKFPDDIEFNPDVVQKAYDFYFPKDDN